jgi:hypothetical protein
MNERLRSRWTPQVIRGGLGEVPKEGGGEKEGSNPADVAEAPLIAKTDFAADVTYLVQNMETFSKIPGKIDEITNYVFSLKDFAKNDANIALRREGVAVFPLSALVDHMLKSAETDWKNKPSFYGAVILECHARMLKINSFLSKK